MGKVSKDTVELNHTINQQDLTDTTEHSIPQRPKTYSFHLDNTKIEPIVGNKNFVFVEKD